MALKDFSGAIKIEPSTVMTPPCEQLRNEKMVAKLTNDYNKANW